MRYLTVMSIGEFSLLQQLQDLLPCITLLAEEEWKVLYVKIHKCPNVTPTIKEAVS